jgi:hypothetical protein
MTSRFINRRSAAAFLVVLVAPLVLAAQAPSQTTHTAAEVFTGTTVNLNPGGGQSLRITVFRWAGDAERDALLAVVKEKGDSGVGPALEKAATAGFIWDSGPLGYAVRYAQKLPLAGGGERIVLVTDRPLGSWGQGAWRPSGRAAATDYPFTLVELRLNKQGRGNGKMSLAAKVVADADAGTITLDNYAAAPVLLNNVRRVSPGS